MPNRMLLILMLAAVGVDAYHTWRKESEHSGGVCVCVEVCVFITGVPITKLFGGGGVCLLLQ